MTKDTSQWARRTVLVFIIAIALWISLGRIIPRPFIDPIESFSIYLPGNPSASTGYCSYMYNMGAAYTCSWEPESEYISLIVTYNETQIISSTTIYFRRGITYGDIVNLIGRASNTRRSGRYTRITWNNGMYSLASTTSLDMYSPMQYLSFTQEDR